MSEDIDNVGGNVQGRLLSFVERIEKVQEEIDDAKDDQKLVYAEAKSVGFDVKIIRKVVARRKMDAEKRREEDELLETYESALLTSMME